MLYESCGYVSGHTFPVEQLFLEDILDKTNYVLEENSLNARKMKKSGTLVPGDITSLECELEMADIQESTAVIKNAATRDENLTASQLYYRYKSKFCRVFNVGIIIAACYM
jgi:ATP-dependent RNA helicase DHX57